jgi:hypothetical protein
VFRVTSIELVPQGVTTKFTRGTGLHTIASKLVVAQSELPVQTNAVLDFTTDAGLVYRALLYELRDKVTGVTSNIVPNWFGVTIPNPATFDLSGDVFVVIYFHPTPGQAHYRDPDYFAKTGTAGGTDWKQLYAYVDRLGGQAAGAIRAGAPANRVVVFPFLTEAQYTLSTAEWFNVIHDILQDINTNHVPNICTRPKKVIVATLSNGGFYLNRFLAESAGLPDNSKIIEAWDFDSNFSQGPLLVNPQGKRLRAYWQSPQSPANTATKTYIRLPLPSWVNFPTNPAQLQEVPPLPPLAPNSVSGPDVSDGNRVHHYIRDTMFLDAVFNIEADNP